MKYGVLKAALLLTFLGFWFGPMPVGTGFDRQAALAMSEPTAWGPFEIVGHTIAPGQKKKFKPGDLI